ncbi:unnamed protein product [Prorocentrum cordatum]|uniref:Uncharacterized protein n=1 Tax=Prorocentrum cordatum TaxID=2364126 RepID=A0ABN9RLZ9_9DINO|nr:unnamed protein product [Polarella glacialis]
MFIPAAELVKKRDAGEAGVESTKPNADTEVAGISKKDRLMTKLLLQHEDNFRGSARDQNVVVRLRVGSQMQVALESSTAHYQKVGKEARDTVAAADYRGHPLGKKPDAYLRMLLFRLSEAVEDRLEEVKAAVAQGANQQESAVALMTLVEFGKSLKDPEVKLKATRCFDVRVTTTIDGKEVEEAKWIYAAMSHPAVMAALYVLKASGGLKSASLILEDDEAPFQDCQGAREDDIQGGRRRNPRKAEAPEEEVRPRAGPSRSQPTVDIRNYFQVRGQGSEGT